MVAVPSIGRASLVEQPVVAPEASATHGLYERHAPKILSYCQHQLGSREEAEDAVQVTYMNAFRALRKGVVPEAEAAWLFKIAENVCLSRRRSSWRRNRIESPADFEVIEEVVPGPNRQRDELIGIEDALASMPEQQRRAILLREWQGLSYREIAEELELSQSAVETLIFRARRSLAQGLTDPATVKPRRKGLRRALHLADLTTLLASAKTVLMGTAAVKATTAAVAVTAIAGGAATVAPKLDEHQPKPALTVSATGLAAAAVAAPAVAEASAAAPTRFVAPSPSSRPAVAKRETVERTARVATAARSASVRAPVAKSKPVAAVAPVPVATPEPVAAPAEAKNRAPVAPAARTPKPDRPEPKDKVKEKEKGKPEDTQGKEAPRAPAAARPAAGPANATPKHDDRRSDKGANVKKNRQEASSPVTVSAALAVVVPPVPAPPVPPTEDAENDGGKGRGKDK